MKKEQKDRMCVMDDPIRSSSFVQSLREAWGLPQQKETHRPGKGRSGDTDRGGGIKSRVARHSNKITGSPVKLGIIYKWNFSIKCLWTIWDIHIFLKTFIVYLKFTLNPVVLYFIWQPGQNSWDAVHVERGCHGKGGWRLGRTGLDQGHSCTFPSTSWLCDSK